MLPLSHPEEPSDSQSEYESLEFPEVPNVLLRPTPGATPENAPEAVKPATYEHTSPDMPFDSENAGDEKLAFIKDEHPAKSSTIFVQVQQSSPFVSLKYVTESEKRDSCSLSSAGVVGPLSTEESGASRDHPRKISDMDLHDVLTAAQAAADSAERAPAAAPFFSHEQNNHQAERLPSTENAQFDHQKSVSSYGDVSELQRPETSSFERRSPDQDHQQMRPPSMEDDPYYSYPNLFTSQNPDRSLGFPSFSDKEKPAHVS
ncbi:unnamed protein product [Brassica rapa subsp. narinosa]